MSQLRMEYAEKIQNKYKIHPTLVESKNAEKINVENTGETFLTHTLK